MAVDKNNLLVDDLDTNLFCTVCSVRDTIIFTLRGACQQSLLGFE